MTNRAYVVDGYDVAFIAYGREVAEIQQDGFAAGFQVKREIDLLPEV